MKLIKKRKNKKGFTLIELLVVLVIIGVIIALILPNTLGAIRQANSKECASNIRAIDTAIQVCYAQTRDWSLCNTSTALLLAPVGVGAQPYLDNFPTCSIIAAQYAIAGGGNATTPAAVNAADHFANWPLKGDPHL